MRDSYEYRMMSKDEKKQFLEKRKKASIMLVGILCIVGVVGALIFKAPAIHRSRANNGAFFSEQTSICGTSAAKAFYDTSHDDGSSPCGGLCYLETYMHILVPCVGSYSNGCNTCRYQGGNGDYGKYTTCKSAGCETTGCDYNGWHFKQGQMVPNYSGDSCNTCQCHKLDDGSYGVVCTENECNTCQHLGSVYAVGATFVDICPANNQDEDGQNMCKCNEGGYVSCDNMDEENANNQAAAGDDDGSVYQKVDYSCDGYCIWQGDVYEPSQCFTSKDGINQCACLDSGKVSCTACDNY